MIHAPNGNARRLDATCTNRLDVADSYFSVGVPGAPPIGHVNAEGVDGFGLMCRPKPQ
jgi:hypothetical protein